MNIKHGLYKSRSYKIWAGMVQRCTNPNHVGFHLYGGRGIKICKRWKIFQNFFDDMGHPPSVKHTIDRRNNNGNYKITNCHWALKKQQERNKRSNIFLTFNGETKCLKDWADSIGVYKSTITRRIKLGWTTKMILTTPSVPKSEAYKYRIARTHEKAKPLQK